MTNTRSKSQPNKRKELMNAIANGDLTQVTALLDQGVSPNLPPQKKNRLLKLLSQSEAPLHAAVRKGNLEIVKILLERGAKVNVYSQHYASPLHAALISLSERTEDRLNIIKALLYSGADPNLEISEGLTPFYYLMNPTYPFYSRENEKVLLDAFCENGADPYVNKGLSKLYSNTVSAVKKINLPHNYDYLAYLLKIYNGSPDKLPFILKNASTELITSLMSYATKHNRADILMDIFKNYERDPTFKFISREYLLIDNIAKCFAQDNLLPNHEKKAVINKLNKIYGENNRYKMSESQLSDNEKSLISIISENQPDITKLRNFMIANPNVNYNIRNQSDCTSLEIIYPLYHVFQKSVNDATDDDIKLKNDSEKVFYLLLNKSNIHMRLLHHQTILHLATTVHDPSLLDIVTFLLKGADPNARDAAGKRPLNYLYNKDNTLKEGMENHKEILEKGIEHFIKPENIQALFEMLTQDSGQIELDPKIKADLVKLITEYPATQDSNGNTLLHRQLLSKEPPDNQKMINLILSGNINIQNKDGNTPLHLACFYNRNSTMIDELINKGARLDIRNKNGDSGFSYLVASGQLDRINNILKNGYTYNDIDIPSLVSILNSATDKNHIELANTILDKFGQTLLAAIDNPDYTGLIKSILIKAVYSSSRNKNDVTILDNLLKNGFGFKLKIYSPGYHPLVEAASKKNIEAMKLLFATGFQINHDTLNSAIRYSHNNVEVIKTLLEHCTSESLNKPIYAANGDTLLHYFTDLNDESKYVPEIVKMLLEKGADPNIQNNKGYSSLHLAVKYKHPDLVKTFLTYGADPLLDKSYWIASLIPSYKSTPVDLGRTSYGNKNTNNEKSQEISSTMKSLLDIKSFLFASLRIGADKGNKHLNYLLKEGYTLENLSTMMIHPYPELLKAMITHAADKKNIEALEKIFTQYSKPQLDFLKNDSKIIKKIIDSVKPNSNDSRSLAVIQKIQQLYPENKEVRNMQNNTAGQARGNRLSSLMGSLFNKNNTLPTQQSPSTEIRLTRKKSVR